MSEPACPPLHRLYYTATQGGRVAWYLAHYALTARLSSPWRGAPRHYSVPLPTLKVLLADLRATFEEEWRDIAAGLYRAPHDALRPPHEVLGQSLAYFADFFAVDRRRRQGATQEAAALAGAGSWPRYYTQNFHFQTDGYLSERSARLYDGQVETLFLGGGDLMRRRALPWIAQLQPARLLDVGCGTGRFLGFVADSFPGIERLALDLSPAYLREAARQLKRWPGTKFIEAKAEKIPEPDASIDLVSAVFLFHELPAQVRTRVLGEIARVLKPGGSFLLLDSLQRGDHPPYDGLLEFFPVAFHEPYYTDYVSQDLGTLAAPHGLRLVETRRAFLSKIALFRKER
ncbi:MAG: class I SAM-dependent methyltransferase [Alphaproteobacteria bacterium]|nr:class I SAM-dependent methyltransferase [Alphaproteobacteria bacterium]